VKNLSLLISSFFISLIIWLSYYSSLPNRVIKHIDSAGTIDYTTKSFMFAIFMIISFCILVVFALLLLIDRKSNSKINKAFAIIGSLFAISLNIVYILNAHNESLHTDSFFLIFIGCIFIVIGNYLPTVRYNLKIGVRNGASFKNKKAWNKIQRFSGNTFVICGLLMSCTALISSFLYAVVTILLIFAIMLFVIQVYSNKLIKNEL